MFYSISDGDSQFFSSKTEDKDEATKAFRFKEKFKFNLNTGFEELSIKIMSLSDKDESVEDETVFKCADHFIELMD